MQILRPNLVQGQPESWPRRSSTVSTVANDGELVRAATNGITVSAPPTPTADTSCFAVDPGGLTTVNVAGNGNTIDGLATTTLTGSTIGIFVFTAGEWKRATVVRLDESSGGRVQLVSDLGVSSGGGGLMGPAASRPAASGSGRVYFCTDIAVAYLDDPTTQAWVQYAAEYMPAPTFASYAVLGSELALAQVGDALVATKTTNAVPSGSAGVRTRATFQTSDVWAVKLTATINAFPGVNYPSIGVAVGRISDSRMFAMTEWWQATGTPGLQLQEFIAGGARTVTTAQTNPVYNGGLASNKVHLRIVSDGSGFLHGQVSTDGFYWIDWYAVTPSFSAFDRWGFWLGNDFAGGNSFAQAYVYRNEFEDFTGTGKQQAITGATGAGVPVQLTMASTAAYRAGDLVSVYGMLGNTAANNGAGTAFANSSQIVKSVDSPTQLTLGNGLLGNGAWTSGGKITLLSR